MTNDTNDTTNPIAPDTTPDTVPADAGKATEPTPNPEATKTTKPAKQRSRTSGKVCSTAGALLVVAAWATLVFDGRVSFFLTAAGVLLSCLGIKGMTRGWRDLSTTSIVAGSVLLLVFAIFYVVVDIVLKAL